MQCDKQCMYVSYLLGVVLSPTIVSISALSKLGLKVNRSMGKKALDASSAELVQQMKQKSHAAFQQLPPGLPMGPHPILASTIDCSSVEAQQAMLVAGPSHM
ncbi:hypothetical protein APHAL10511_006898 [Amanita phalloides]|nr:hypothetical protein APHAL10511_006898 [Amanita phalloides]